VTAESDRKTIELATSRMRRLFLFPSGFPAPSLVLVRHVPIHDREQDLAADARFLQNVPLGLQKNCIDRLGQRINLFVDGCRRIRSDWFTRLRVHARRAVSMDAGTRSQGLRRNAPTPLGSSRVSLLATHLWCHHSIFSKDSLAVVCVG
jgi:hypothetical protein